MLRPWVVWVPVTVHLCCRHCRRHCRYRLQPIQYMVSILAYTTNINSSSSNTTINNTTLF